MNDVNVLVEKLSRHENNVTLTIEEFDFMLHRMTNGVRKNYALGTLPYVTPTEKRLVDSIAKKLNLNKFYRGPRPTFNRRGSICRTLKEDAVAVALYRKP